MDNEIILNRKKIYVSFIVNCDFRYSFLSIHVHVYGKIFNKKI